MKNRTAFSIYDVIINSIIDFTRMVYFDLSIEDQKVKVQIKSQVLILQNLMSNKIYESKTIIITIFHNNFHNTTPTNNKIQQTTNKTIERSYRAPCVVLVINDNPYGLMVALSYMCRTCP
jgi:hypothetical protein